MALLSPSTNLESETRKAPGIGLADFYLLLLRLTLALPLFFYQVRQHTIQAWGFLWEQKEWPLHTAMVEMQLPQPPVTAVALIFVLLVCPWAIAIGFLTRVNAVLTLAALLFLFFSTLPFSEWMTGQTYVLFLGIAAVLTISGSGRFSLDGIFAARRRRIQRLRAEAM